MDTFLTPFTLFIASKFNDCKHMMQKTRFARQNVKENYQNKNAFIVGDYIVGVFPIAETKWRFNGTIINQLECTISPWKYVDEMFDVDFCKIMCDGDRIYIRNFDDIWHRESTVDLNDRHIPSYILGKEKENLHDALMEKLKLRKDKYASRGFQIVFK